VKEQACEWARSAGRVLLEYYNGVPSVRLKDSQSDIVTEADVDSEKLIVQHIQASFPDHSILGEETGWQQRSSDFTWVVDPLDGTSNFVVGIPWFGVLLALLEKDQPVLGILHLPVSGDLYTAEKGGGAYRNGQRLQVNDETDLSRVLWAVGMDVPSTGAAGRREVDFLVSLARQVRNLRSTNSLLDAVYTAEGRLGGMLNLSNKVWDVAAPSLLINEAGGMFTDLQGKALAFPPTEAAHHRNYAVLAGAPALYAQVLRLVDEARIFEKAA
jgi:myo-inositol-1(or 4)-monophosphatase